MQSFACKVNTPEFPEGQEWINAGRPVRLADLRGKPGRQAAERCLGTERHLASERLAPQGVVIPQDAIEVERLGAVAEDRNQVTHART